MVHFEKNNRPIDVENFSCPCEYLELKALKINLLKIQAIQRLLREGFVQPSYRNLLGKLITCRYFVAIGNKRRCEIARLTLHQLPSLKRSGKNTKDGGVLCADK